MEMGGAEHAVRGFQLMAISHRPARERMTAIKRRAVERHKSATGAGCAVAGRCAQGLSGAGQPFPPARSAHQQRSDFSFPQPTQAIYWHICGRAHMPAANRSWICCTLLPCRPPRGPSILNFGRRWTSSALIYTASLPFAVRCYPVYTFPSLLEYPASVASPFLSYTLAAILCALRHDRRVTGHIPCPCL